MAEDVVIARFRADLDQVMAEFNQYIAGLEKVQKEEKETQTETKKTATVAESAAKKRTAAIKAEQQELARLRQARSQAFTPKDVENFNKQISESQNRIATLRGTTQSTGETLKGVFTSIAAGIAAAFSVQAVIQFGRASIEAFLEAEESATRLKFAVSSIANEGDGAFNELITQAGAMQRAFGIADEAVQDAQAALISFGLSTAQVKNIIPILNDFATITGQTLQEASQSLGQAIQGRAGEFKRFGIQVSDTATEVENLNSVIAGLASQEGAAAKQAETLTGQLKIQEAQVDELQEQVGKGLAPAWLAVKRAVFEATLATVRFFESGGNLALSLLKKELENLPTAYDQVTKKVEEQTAALVKEGFTQAEASKNAIESIRAEINQRLALAIDKAKAAQADKNLDVVEKQRIANRLSAIRNELNAVIALENARKNELKDQAELLDRLELKKLSIEQLNKLLSENSAKNSINAQSNVKLLNQEIEIRKKLTEEMAKAAAKALEELKKLNGDVIKLPPIELKVNLDVEEVKPINPQVPTELKLRPPDGNEFQDGLDNTFQAVLESWLDTNAQIIEATQELLSTLSSAFSTYYDAQINEIETKRDKELKAIDEADKAVDASLDKRRISEKEAERQHEQLLKQREQAESEAAKKIREIKRKQAILDKAAAIFDIAINTAKNVVSAETPALIAFYVALGAAQAAIVAAQPIPYRRGSKDTGREPHMAIVGEEGRELVYMPPHSKVLPAPQTRKNMAAIEAMREDRLEDFVFKQWVAPALDKQRRDFEESKERSFTQNLGRSIVINNAAPGKKKGIDSVRVENWGELKEYIDSTRKSPYRT